MAFCVDCGKENPAAEAKFCPFCGTPNAILGTKTPKAKPAPTDEEALRLLVNKGAKLMQAGKLREGIEITLPAVEAGIPMAMNNVGKAYLDLGETKEGIALLSKAAAQGVEQAMWSLYGFYTNDGEPAQKDYRECEKWLKRLADLGDAEAMFELYLWNVEILDKPKIARGWLDKAAALGHAPAKDEILDLGIKEDYVENKDGTWSITWTATEPGGLGKMPKAK